MLLATKISRFYYFAAWNLVPAAALVSFDKVLHRRFATPATNSGEGGDKPIRDAGLARSPEV
jgi:hypothetical protein